MQQRRMLLTGYNRSTRIKTRPSAVLSTTDLTQIGPGSNPGFGEEGAGANCLKHGRPSHAPRFAKKPWFCSRSFW